MRVIEIDPEDDEQLLPWLAVRNRASLHDWPDEPGLTLNEARVFGSGFGASRAVMLAALGTTSDIEGIALLMMPMRDNLWTAALEDVEVVPEGRRAGVGTALVAHAEDLARAAGRTTLTAASMIPMAVPSGADEPSQPFAAALGYEAALDEYRRDLFLPLDLDQLAALEDAARPAAADYEIVTFEDRCPDHLVEGRLELERGMSTDAPHGALEHEEAKWDEARLRTLEEKAKEMGNRSFFAGAVHAASGLLVAVTVIGVNRDTPQLGRQWLTIVGREHRGHKLGMLVKIANLRRVLAEAQAVTRIQTWNAASNIYMAQVNEELGFKVTARGIHWQKRLEPASGSALDTP